MGLFHFSNFYLYHLFFHFRLEIQGATVMPIFEFRFILDMDQTTLDHKFLLSFCPNDEKWYFWFFLDNYGNRNIFEKELTPIEVLFLYEWDIRKALVTSFSLSCQNKILRFVYQTNEIEFIYIHTPTHWRLWKSLPYRPEIDPWLYMWIEKCFSSSAAIGWMQLGFVNVYMKTDQIHILGSFLSL